MVVGEKEARERRVDSVSCLGGADIIRQHLLASPHERMMASPIRLLSSESAKCVTQPSSRSTCSRHCSRRRRHRRITVVNVSCAHKRRRPSCSDSPLDLSDSQVPQGGWLPTVLLTRTALRPRPDMSFPWQTASGKAER